VRSSFDCISSGKSPISSNSTVPPFACNKSPVRWLLASVNAPRKCPKSSLSMSAGERAAQLIATNGPALRRLRAWIERAMSSLPVPVSPWMSTDASLSATRMVSS
jgi:hypothetical protein